MLAGEGRDVSRLGDKAFPYCGAKQSGRLYNTDSKSNSRQLLGAENLGRRGKERCFSRRDLYLEGPMIDVLVQCL